MSFWVAGHVEKLTDIKMRVSVIFDSLFFGYSVQATACTGCEVRRAFLVAGAFAQNTLENCTVEGSAGPRVALEVCWQIADGGATRKASSTSSIRWISPSGDVPR